METGDEVFTINCRGDTWDLFSGHIVSAGKEKIFIYPRDYYEDHSVKMVETKNCYPTKLSALLAVPCRLGYFHDHTRTGIRPADLSRLSGCQILLETIKMEQKNDNS